MNNYYRRACPTRSSGLFRCDGFARDATIPSISGDSLPLRELPPFLRTLLVTDGTVTKLIEAYFWEPIIVETIEQRVEPAAEPVEWIQLALGDKCLLRNARLRGADSKKNFVEAFSLICLDLIPPGLRRRLIDRAIGIGVMIRDSGLESYREILDVGLDRMADGMAAVFRTYRIFIDQHAVILITEYFPLALYRL